MDRMPNPGTHRSRTRTLCPTPLRLLFLLALLPYWVLVTPISAEDHPPVAQVAETTPPIAQWPSFRGPQARGIGPRALPISWDLETGTNVLWRTSIPGLGHSSPVIWGDRIFVTTAVAEGAEAELKVGLYGSGWSADDKGPQSWRVLALDRETGEVVWQRERDEFPGWGTPTVHRRGGRTHILVNGYKHMGGYDLEDGRELWRLSGGGDIPVPTPVVAHGMVYLTNAHGGPSPIYAIDLDARGLLTLPGGTADGTDGTRMASEEPPESPGLVWTSDKGGA